ncbi:MAG TPA: Holliday junction resolvase-like protein, partial [Candidatus Hypogeohydataceae bacterium YC40]
MRWKKTLFKESEKKIREKSVSSSRRTLVGKFIERFVPFLPDLKYSASDMHFIGQPIDYIVFDGLRDDKIKKVVFLEVKTGNS